jgi:hypothetical protein
VYCLVSSLLIILSFLYYKYNIKYIRSGLILNIDKPIVPQRIKSNLKNIFLKLRDKLMSLLSLINKLGLTGSLLIFLKNLNIIMSIFQTHLSPLLQALSSNPNKNNIFTLNNKYSSLINLPILVIFIRLYQKFTHKNIWLF